jgi:hypothetical protein
VYQRILQLTYVEELLNALKALFVKYFEPAIRTFVDSLHASPSTTSGKKVKGKSEGTKQWDITSMLMGWDKLFDELLKTLQDRAAQVRSSPTIILLPLRLTDVSLRNVARVYAHRSAVLSRSPHPPPDPGPASQQTAPPKRRRPRSRRTTPTRRWTKSRSLETSKR